MRKCILAMAFLLMLVASAYSLSCSLRTAPREPLNSVGTDESVSFRAECWDMGGVPCPALTWSHNVAGGTLAPSSTPASGDPAQLTVVLTTSSAPMQFDRGVSATDGAVTCAEDFAVMSYSSGGLCAFTINDGIGFQGTSGVVLCRGSTCPLTFFSSTGGYPTDMRTTYKWTIRNFDTGEVAYTYNQTTTYYPGSSASAMVPKGNYTITLDCNSSTESDSRTLGPLQTLENDPANPADISCEARFGTFTPGSGSCVGAPWKATYTSTIALGLYNQCPHSNDSGVCTSCPNCQPIDPGFVSRDVSCDCDYTKPGCENCAACLDWNSCDEFDYDVCFANNAPANMRTNCAIVAPAACEDYEGHFAPYPDFLGIPCGMWDGNELDCSQRVGCQWCPTKGEGAPCTINESESYNSNLYDQSLGYGYPVGCCTEDARFCAQPSGGGATTCRACIPIGSPTLCVLSTECCGGGVCDPITETCVPGAPNNPPNPPVPSPGIISAPSPLTASGLVSCDANCPPTVMPIDPDGNTVHIEYLWYKNLTAIGAWSATLTSLDCAANGCAAGDVITLRAKACDDGSPVLCSAEVVSNSISVQAPPPPGPIVSSNTTYPILAVVIAFAILGLAYMASYVFGMASLRAIVQDEVLQVIATGAIALALLGVNGAVDVYMVDMLKATNATVTCTDPTNASTCDKSMMGEANSVLAGLQSQAGGLLLNIGDVSTEIGKEASRGVFCNFLGVGYTLVNCSQLNAFRGGMTTAAFATSTALADTYAQQFLLSLARAFAFTFLLPIGLFLRCFKISRQAGGALIAIGFGFYTAYPAVIVATDRLLHGSSPPTPYTIRNFESVAGGVCDPMQVSVQNSYGKYNRYAIYISEFQLTENLAYFSLVRVLFTSILSLIITLGFIRALAHIIGSEIDVSALARIS